MYQNYPLNLTEKDAKYLHNYLLTSMEPTECNDFNIIASTSNSLALLQKSAADMIQLGVIERLDDCRKRKSVGRHWQLR